MPTSPSRRAALRRAAAKRRGSWGPSAEEAEREIRRAKLRRYRRHRQNVLMLLVILSLIAGGLTYYFGFDLMVVRGAGMSPALESGDRVLCVKQSLLNKLAGIVPESFRRVDRGDPVVLSYKLDNGETVRLIKRIVALGGDELDSGGGELILNREALAGLTGESDLVYPVRVPAGRLFVTGDHSAVSVDSRRRAFGMVAEADVVGRPLFIVWPLFAVGRVS
ncbi:MAG: signal peptidase I [Clostridia bacterium]|nr:signal peptidase I [Clostridia bacterium]